MRMVRSLLAVAGWPSESMWWLWEVKSCTRLASPDASNRSGVINAEVALMVDSIKTITAVGALNDSTKAADMARLMAGEEMLRMSTVPSMFSGWSLDPAMVNASNLTTLLSSPFLLDFTMIKMPLKIANPFLPKDMARLSGTLNGAMEITGNLANPVFNGYLDFGAIGAGAVVTKDILEPGTTWAGVPARKISDRDSHNNLCQALFQ